MYGKNSYNDTEIPRLYKFDKKTKTYYNNRLFDELYLTIFHFHLLYIPLQM